MSRDFKDKTSTCGSCKFWEHIKNADGLHPTRLGVCGYLSVPGWAQKQLPANYSTKMREDEGLECWLHTKREVPSGVHK